MKKTDKTVVIDMDFEEIATEQKVAIAEEPSKARAVDAASEKSEVLCGVVLKRCPVVKWNPYSNVIVYERDGILIQSNAIEYHGEGYVEVE